MYLLYESHTDETRNMREDRFNTHILGLYEDKRVALEKLEEVVEDTITNVDDKYNWFKQELDIDLVENKNIVKVYTMFNEEIENCMELYYIILEKVEIKKEENENE